MARCAFCGWEGRNPQAVRGHLRTCEAYRSGQPKAQPIGSGQPKAEPKAGPRQTSPGDERTAQLQREVQAEQARLRLREIQAQHRELDEREQARQQREDETALAKLAELNRQLDQQRARRCEELIRQIVGEVVKPHPELPAETTSAARAAAEAAADVVTGFF